jgi:hypothetical protein
VLNIPTDHRYRALAYLLVSLRNAKGLVQVALHDGTEQILAWSEKKEQLHSQLLLLLVAVAVVSYLSRCCLSLP